MSSAQSLVSAAAPSTPVRAQVLPHLGGGVTSRIDAFGMPTGSSGGLDILG